MPDKFNDTLKTVLKKDPRFVDEQTGDLITSEIITQALKIDRKLIELLLENKQTKDKFFIEIKGHWVFNINDFTSYIQDKNFLNDSYTKFKNKIGLTIDGKHLNERGEVALAWPFKDCVLEGGMTKEDQERNEIFFNEILAQDEIDRLLDPKVLTNFKKYTAKGEEKVTTFTRDAEGTIKDNLIIKGNNLLALHSLSTQFHGKIKMIYIDPPYNIGDGDFGYNDRFNHSTWLTFIKNRLEIAKKLLRDDGAMFVQIDHHEIAYLNILMDEVFGSTNKVQVITTKVSAASGFKSINPGPIDVTEFILFYTKNRDKFTFQKNYVKASYHKNYNLYLERAEKVENWRLVPLKDKVLKLNKFKTEKELRSKFGNIADIIFNKLVSDFAFEHANNVVSIRDLHKPSEKLKKLQEASRKERDKIFVYTKTDGSSAYLINGGVLAFYSSKIRKIEGKLVVTELLTNFWNHISWAGIAKEGKVRLKNGKKPEKLLKQIVELVGPTSEDIILDFHVGSGTTCAVAHKLGIQYIGIEQLEYGENGSVRRLKNVIGKENSKGKLRSSIEDYDSSGISRAVNWRGGGSFVYCELMKFNEGAVDKIVAAKGTEELLKLWSEICEEYFLNYDLDIKRFNDNKDEFKKLPLSKQKTFLIEMLNKNQLYVNLSEIDDSEFKVSKEDKELNRKFYQL